MSDRLPLKTYLSAKNITRLFVALTITRLLIGCAAFKKELPASPESALKKISSFAYPLFFDDMAYDGLEHGIMQSLAYLQTVPADRRFRFGKDSFSTDHMVRSLEEFQSFIENNPSQNALKKFIKTNFWVYQSIGRDSSRRVLFTGYYEPIIRGSRQKSEPYLFPVYARPDDLLTIDLSLFSPRFEGDKITGRYTGDTVVPYYDRREIEQAGRMTENAEYLAWVKDRVDLFFLHIQGSGKIYLEDGKALNIHYHATNGRPYRSIGKLLIDEGKIARAEMSMQKIRAYLEEHPEEIEKVLYHNPSYVFFKVEEDGPLGYLDVKLTPARSLAVDRRIFPLPALAFIETRQPLMTGGGDIDQWTDCRRFAVTQDTGGAIRGPGRADLFWGNGPYAEIAAGHMQHMGKLYFLVLKPDRR